MESFSPDPPFTTFQAPQAELNEPGKIILNLRRANTVAPGGNIKRNLGLKAAREKTAGRVQESQVSVPGKLQRSQTHRAAPHPPRKVGHFTVRSVGQNGKIFLR